MFYVVISMVMTYICNTMSDIVVQQGLWEGGCGVHAHFNQQRHENENDIFMIMDLCQSCCHFALVHGNQHLRLD